MFLQLTSACCPALDKIFLHWGVFITFLWSRLEFTAEWWLLVENSSAWGIFQATGCLVWTATSGLLKMYIFILDHDPFEVMRVFTWLDLAMRWKVASDFTSHLFHFCAYISCSLSSFIVHINISQQCYNATHFTMLLFLFADIAWGISK